MESIAIAADTERCDQVGTPLSSWAAERWTDLALAVAWLLDHGVGTAAQQASLFELGRTLHEQGTDWERCFSANFTGCPGWPRRRIACAAMARITSPSAPAK